MSKGYKFIEALERKAPMFAYDAIKHYEQNPEDVSFLLDPLAQWSEAAYGESIFEEAVKGYAGYAMHVAVAQRKYEKAGKYTPSDISEIKSKVYEDETYMIPYMWGAILIYSFWPSVLNHLALYRDDFISQIPKNGRMLEMACGHGVLGLLAAKERSDIQVKGLDISPSAINIAKRLAVQTDFEERLTFAVQDVLTLDEDEEKYDAILAAMIVEHLEAPQDLIDSLSRNLKPNGIAFISTALESAQKDHIFEFHNESELLIMAEKAGLRVVKLICDSRGKPDQAQFTPRAMAMIVEKKDK
jgi:2-polyprenyl-3-methyl-5-hydroxy-6-metoxy-1,4-benzoquinol methylase